MKKLILAVCASLLIASNAWAVTESDGPSTVSLISSQTLVTVFQLTTRVGTDDCFLGLVSLDITTDQGKAQYDAILTAQIEGTEIAISYEQVGAVCTLNFVNRLPI